MTSAHGTRRQGRRWRLESWDKKHETWAEEACWYDGTNVNGTPRLDRAIKEAHELIDKGMTVRIFDLWDCTAHYINPDRGIAPNVELTGAAAGLSPQRPATEGSEVERRVGGQADASAP